MNGKIVSLSSFPIKGLSPQAHQSAPLKTGDGFPGDRLFGFAKASSGFDPADPKPLPKHNFIVLLQHARLAGLETGFDPESRVLTIRTKDAADMRFDMNTQEGADGASEFLTRLLGLKEQEVPFFASAFPHRFTDASVASTTLMNAISFINLDSVRAFESEIGREVDARRFRGNIVFDGWPAFSELDLVGRHFRVGEVSFNILHRTQRCLATEVNPDTAERDMKLPNLLKKAYGHFDMGIYAEVLNDGVISVGDEVVLIDA
ncbi:MOSC domain-containing protein [Hoeflea alexandrii]|uniref:MOSC domain-containing protein n=1 Tax=Hoeflea alexandrii TaxID=288436 RepID=A0ABT1CWG6_9HYPH|nr:MOSC domain-containing protein [Hoeflea alexandrii]MCO6409880.1 MOSC domain-containing protein [Hoeflea alexandrii]